MWIYELALLIIHLTISIREKDFFVQFNDISGSFNVKVRLKAATLNVLGHGRCDLFKCKCRKAQA